MNEIESTDKEAFNLLKGKFVHPHQISHLLDYILFLLGSPGSGWGCI